MAAAAADALAEFGQDCLPALASALADGATDPACRAAIPRVLERLGNAESIQLLHEFISDPDERVAAASLRGLANARRRDPSFPLMDDTMREDMVEALRRCYTLAALRADLGRDAHEPLLDDALSRLSARALDRVFLILACLHPDRHVEWARRAIDSPARNTRALAVEFVVMLAERRIEDLLLALVDAPENRVVELAERRFAVVRRPAETHLRELARDGDAWVAACAIRRIGQRGSRDLAPSVEEALARPEPIVRETALSARMQLAGAQA